MIPAIRKQYNEQFSKEKYQSYINDLDSLYPGQIDFRIAETPVFVPKEFTKKMLSTCEGIIDIIIQPDYLKESERAVLQHLQVPNNDGHTNFIVFDFGVCLNDKGELEPQLIEMQGFPSLFALQVLMPEAHHKNFGWPKDFDFYLNDLQRNDYIQLLKEIIIYDAQPENTVLLEILPHQQKTRIDFYATQTFLGIDIVCITELIVEGKNLFYIRDGKKKQIKRIYNRVIFDELNQQTAAVQEKGKLLFQDLNVELVPHPNWFYRLSKFTLPFIKHPFVPETLFLNEVKELPQDLENYVVKPLFSFAGKGILIDVIKEEIQKITDPENWILQKKVQYAPIIETPDGRAKAEIRLFYFWEPNAPRPRAVNNLCRLSKGKMIGVQYNKDKEWVGGSFCLFEK